MSVFSKFLDPYIEEGLLQDMEQSKPSEIWHGLSIAYNQGSEGVKNTTRLFVPYYEQDDDDYDYDLLYYIWSNKYLKELIQWFNSKIIPEFTTMSYQTINVRIRIFCGKLNKLVDDGLVDKEFAIRIHLNLVDTIREEYDLRVNEDLPFLPRQPNLDWYSNGAHEGGMWFDSLTVLLNSITIHLGGRCSWSHAFNS